MKNEKLNFSLTLVIKTNPQVYIKQVSFLLSFSFFFKSAVEVTAMASQSASQQQTTWSFPCFTQQ